MPLKLSGSNAPQVPVERLLLLEREGGLLIAGDSLQNWQATDAFFSPAERLLITLHA